RGGPAGGGYSTVMDLVQFATALHTHRILSAATTELLLTPKPELHATAYGYGFSVDPSQNIVGHGGGFPGISSNLDIFRNSGYRDRASRHHIAQSVCRLLHGHWHLSGLPASFRGYPTGRTSRTVVSPLDFG